ncbi:MAG TPA: YjjG family noncanonical pyrimidine nucleotidase [Verrucomicrobiae bacterium]|nr:YjjG family noncanonical pyrimidine nucleotidase [Verrucomicrobiae bacterium]
MQRYQWLLFDADGTLFDFDRAEGLALQETFRLQGVPFDPAYLPIYRRISRTLWDAVERGETTPSQLKVRRFELLLETLGLTHAPADFSASYIESLAARPELITDAAEVVHALAGKYKLAILTNGLQAVQRPRFARSAIRDHITQIVVSDEIGVSKPAKEYFDAAFAQLGNPPKHETLMIGDGWAADILGGVNYGIDTCWHNPAKKPRPSELRITREISSLRDLLPWLMG